LLVGSGIWEVTILALSITTKLLPVIFKEDEQWVNWDVLRLKVVLPWMTFHRDVCSKLSTAPTPSHSPQLGMGSWPQPVRLSQLSAVHGSLSSQLSGDEAGWQPVKELQVSMPLQALPSWQLTGTWEILPVAGLQESVVQALLSLTFFGIFLQPVEGWQLSVVHLLLSSQTRGGMLFSHWPVEGLQTGAEPLHWLPSSEQTT
jgi:hypothetical protein